MLILFFFFLLTEQQRDIEFNDKFYWTSMDSVNDKNIYRITNLEQPYYYVQVTLLQQDLSYFLLYDLNQIPKLNESPGDYVRTTRFLKIEPNGKIIYITASSNSTSGYYNIAIWGSKKEYCDNSCSYYGECTDDGCECISGYISTDCHQTALQVQESQTQINLFGDEIQFFYLNIGDYKEMDIQLRLSTDSSQGIEIFIELTNAIIIPNQNYHDAEGMIKQQIIYESQPLDFKIKSAIYEYDNIQVVFGARQLNGRLNSLVSTLLIEISTYNMSENTISIIVIIIIVIVISAAVIIIIIMFFVCKNIRSRKLLLQQQRLRMAMYGESSGNQQKDQINIFDYLSPVQIDVLNNQDDCIICLQKLNDELEVRQTCCQYQMIVQIQSPFPFFLYKRVAQQQQKRMSCLQSQFSSERWSNKYNSSIMTQIFILNQINQLFNNEKYQ
ncbi:unnamed protein product [Paramecium octaurelia]|uniref:EGF-like domain-containing protein n=1 Tax=Paramecium octaurelia TaxID=43137 RepID=A0A8S1VMU7_PAROT|nr:unnamed protein product [Paramecium octaurelia]